MIANAMALGNACVMIVNPVATMLTNQVDQSGCSIWLATPTLPLKLNAFLKSITPPQAECLEVSSILACYSNSPSI